MIYSYPGYRYLFCDNGNHSVTMTFDVKTSFQFKKSIGFTKTAIEITFCTWNLAVWSVKPNQMCVVSFHYLSTRYQAIGTKARIINSLFIDNVVNNKLPGIFSKKIIIRLPLFCSYYRFFLVLKMI